MKGELISSVSAILNEWNPLGEEAAKINDLDGYKYEAIDILSTIQITNSSVEKSVSLVISQAFGISLDATEVKYYSSKIENLLNVQ